MLYAIKNFERFQHYKERKPPWVKLYRDLWRDRDFFRLSERSKLLFLGLTTIASVTGNQIPDDPEWLALELGLDKKSIDLNPLISAGFLLVEQVASKPLAVCKQDALVETEYRDREETDLAPAERESEPDGEEKPEESFDRFYAEYPRHKARDAALKAWKKLKPAERRAAFADLPKRKAGEWLGKDPDYLPYPASYLNGKRWTDEANPPRGSPALAPPRLRTADDYDRYLMGNDEPRAIATAKSGS